MVNSVRPRRTRLSVDDRRAQLLEVCLDLIGTRSWDALTMADIAAAAGVSKPLLYHYFSTKAEIYVAAVSAAAAELADTTELDLRLPGKERTHAALQAHLEWIEAHAPSYRAILHGGVSGDPTVQSIVERSRSQVVRRITHAIGARRPSPTVRIALRGWIGFLEAASLDWLDHQDLTKEQLVDLLARSLSATIRTANESGDAHRTDRDSRLIGGSPASSPTT